MTPLYLFPSPPAWWTRLDRLGTALELGEARAARRAYASVLSTLANSGYADLTAAAADLLLYHSTPFSRAMIVGEAPAGLVRAIEADLATLVAAVRRDWAGDMHGLGERAHPRLMELAARPAGADLTIAEALAQETPADIRARLERHYRQHGDGSLARHLAFRWDGRALVGIHHPSMPRMERLVGLERQLDQLAANTESFLTGEPAHHVLLYGPRGSGKSTAVRALLPKHHARGLRLVETSPDDLEQLPLVLEQLRGRPHRYILFVDDLSYERGDTAYHPLKTLLEGSLTAPPENALLYATSNRRHLVTETFADRPDPLDEDVHAWDTQHERLALSDRFGLAITFPDASQRRYLEIVHGLVADLDPDLDADLAAEPAAGRDDGARNRRVPDTGDRDGIPADLDERAIRFAEWGNGYSGRTAEQFVRTLRSRTRL